jgi:FixJ family two-component response regulator
LPGSELQVTLPCSSWRASVRHTAVDVNDARTPVIFVTPARATDAAVEAMKQGAYDDLCK